MTAASRPVTTGEVLSALDRATAHLDPPFAALHLPTVRSNLADLTRRAGGTPVRVATKSVRCRQVLDLALADPGVRGLMAYSLREALWLSGLGYEDVLLGYPTVDRGALRALAVDGRAREHLTLMVDDVRQLEIAREAGCAGVRVCLDVDASLRIGPVHLGVRRSPLRTPAQVQRLARAATAMGFVVDGLMFYEAQVAGVPDDVRGIGLVKAVSMRRLRAVRGEVADAVTSATGRALRIVNSGGTGSVAESAADPVVTEVTAGSGLYVPTLFDHYRSFTPRPALFFALAATRRPDRGLTTLQFGGYVASGPPGADRLPRPAGPIGGSGRAAHPGLDYLDTEAAGEVQTPVRGELPIGGRAWFRPAKAGESAERFREFHVVDEADASDPAGSHLAGAAPTYRGEGECFG